MATAVLQPEQGQAARETEMVVPSRLNVLLTGLLIPILLALLWLGSHVQSWQALLCTAVGFSYLMLTNYALLHEATHAHLHQSPRWNYWLGVVTGILFPVPFTMIRLTHRGHHDRNRSDAEMFDLYYANDNLLIKYWIWYATLTGWFWPLVPLGAILVGILPRSLYVRLFRTPPWRNPSLDDLTSVDLWRIRGELLLIVSAFIAVAWLLELRLLNTLLLYACFSFNWSTRQYIGHAFSPRHVIEGAWNLRHNKLMTGILLNGNWDLNHHRYPEAPWTYLPRLSAADERPIGYVRQYWRQWRGPRLTTDDWTINLSTDR